MLSFVCFSFSTCFPHIFRPVCLSARVLSSSCFCFPFVCYTSSLKPHHISLSLSILIVVYFSHFFFSSSPSRFSYTTLNANIWKRTDIGTEKKREREIERINDECSSREEGLMRILSHSFSSLYLSVYILFVFLFSLFNKNFLYVRNHSKKKENDADDDDELLNLMLKSSACQ